MKELESLLLRTIKPNGHRAGGRFAKLLNILPALNYSMNDYDADWRALLLGGAIARRWRHHKGKRGTGTIQLVGVVERPVSFQAYHNKQKYVAVLR